LKYEHTLFTGFGGVSQVAKSVRLPGNMSAFLNQDPKQVAAFVSECLDYRRFEAPDLDPFVTRETLQERVWMIIVLILFRLIMMILLLMSLDMILMPIEPRQQEARQGGPHI
jgi:hypothetical protein